MALLSLTDPHTYALVCDRCGRSLPAVTATAPSWPMLWALATDQGWDCDAAPDRHHQCATCSGRSTHPASVGAPGVELRVGDTATLIRLFGPLTAATAPFLQAVFRQVSVMNAAVVADLAGVPAIDVTALAVLVHTHQALRANGGVICLTGTSPAVLSTLRLLHLDGVFPVFTTTRAALTALLSGNVITASPITSPQRVTGGCRAERP